MGKVQNRIMPRVFLCYCLLIFSSNKCGGINNSFLCFIRFVNSVITIATFVLLLNGVCMRFIHWWNVLNNLLNIAFLAYRGKRLSEHHLGWSSLKIKRRRESFDLITEEAKQSLTRHRNSLESCFESPSTSPFTRKLMMLARRWITSDSTQSSPDKWAPARLTPASTRRKTNSHVSCYL